MNTPRTTALAILTASVVILAGCSTGGPNDAGHAPASTAATTSAAPVTTPAQTPSATPTPTPSPTPTELSLADAGAAYLAMVGPSNDAAGPLNAALQKSDWKAARTAAGPAAVALRKFADQIAATPWPAKVQPTATALLGEVGAQILLFEQIANAKTDQAVIDALNAYDPPPGNSGQTMRILLGLPNAPTA